MKPWLLLPPKWAHDLSPLALPLYSYFFAQDIPAWKSFSWRGLTFKNPLGIAGGVDKNAENLKDWWALGCGFVEVGTVTPLEQQPNPGKIMDRDKIQNSLWNKMGFPSHGAEEVYYNIRSYAPYYRTPIFVNIGKNRQTPNHQAVDDYLSLIQTFHSVADVFVVNISSPNTQGLRELQSKENLTRLFSPLTKKLSQLGSTPLLVKLSPDMPEDLLGETVQHCAQLGVDGFVLTNTTLSRPPACTYPPEGGLSGAPLKNLSEQALKTALSALGSARKDKLLVSVGGVMSAEDVQTRLDLGADLVQIYSALVFEGPGFFHKVAGQYQHDKKHD